MMRFTKHLLLVFCFGVFLAAPAAAFEGTDRPLRVGIAVGLMGQLPVGDDVGQPGASGDEFGPAMGVDVQVFTVDIGSFLQLVPFFRTVLSGGVDEEVCEQILGTSEMLEGTPEGSMAQMGLGARVFPLGSSALRPFMSGYLSYVTAGVSYEVSEIDPSGVPEPFGDYVTPTSELRRHTGLGLSVGLGLRTDLATNLLGEDVWIPVALELMYSKNLWLDLDENPERDFEWDLLSPEGMDLDAIAFVLSVGYMK